MINIVKRTLLKSEMFSVLYTVDYVFLKHLWQASLAWYGAGWKKKSRIYGQR